MVPRDQLDNCAWVEHMNSAVPDRLDDFRTRGQMCTSWCGVGSKSTIKWNLKNCTHSKTKDIIKSLTTRKAKHNLDCAVRGKVVIHVNASMEKLFLAEAESILFSELWMCPAVISDATEQEDVIWVESTAALLHSHQHSSRQGRRDDGKSGCPDVCFMLKWTIEGGGGSDQAPCSKRTVHFFHDVTAAEMVHAASVNELKLWCMEWSRDPQAETGVPTIAVTIFIVQNSDRNKVRITNHARKHFNRKTNQKCSKD